MQNFKIVSFDSAIEHGQMSSKFINNVATNEEKRNILNMNKQNFISQIGLNYKQIFINIQKNKNNSYLYEDGFCYTLNEQDIKDYDDLFDFDVYADIVKLTPDTRNIAIAYPVADCAVVKAVNFKTNEITISHCGGEYIDRYLPMQTIDALGGNENDIRIFISPFAHTLFYEDSKNLTWANNQDVWKNFIEEKDKDGITSIKINIYKALKEQLLHRKIKEENIYFSAFDTCESNLFYSHCRSQYDEKLKGRFLSGMAIVDKKIDIKQKQYIKIIK